MDLFILFRVLLKRLWILITIPLIIVVATFFLTANLPLKYKSTAQLATGFTTQDKIQVTEERVNLHEASVKFSNLIETINSELILTLLSYRLLIHDLESPSDAFRMPKGQSFTDSLSREEKMKYLKMAKAKYDSMELLSPYHGQEQKIIQLLSDREYLGWQLKPDLLVFQVKNTDYVKIQYDSENPFLSAYVVNTLAEEYIRYENSLNRNFSGESVDFFAKQMQEKHQVLEQKKQAYDNFLKSKGLLNYGVESDAKISQISQYELLEQEAVAEVQRLSLSLENVNSKLSQPSRMNDESEINRKIVEIRNRINKATNLYRSSGSTDTTLERTIRNLRYELQLQMDKLPSATGATDPTVLTKEELQAKKEDLELQLRIARENLTSVRNNLGNLKSSISGYAANEATLQNLKREMDRATEDFNAAEERYNRELDKAKISETSVRLVIKGQPNPSPESTKRWMIIGMAGAGSFGFCAFIIIVLELLDMRLKTPDQFKKLTSLNLAGTVPLVPVKGLELVNLFNASNKNADKETFKHFLRKLRYELEKDSSQVYLVTSNKVGEGKSFLIMCLAFTLSLLKKKILIIDTNFKNNSLTQALLQNHNRKRIEQSRFLLSSGDYQNSSGQGTENENDANFANSIVSKTPHNGIFIIGNTGEQASPSEIFAGKDFHHMIDQLRLHYDYIFLEGPAMNEYSDTQELVGYVDKVLPMFASNSVIRQLDRDSIEYLKSLDGKLMGGVLNKVQLKNINI